MIPQDLLGIILSGLGLDRMFATIVTVFQYLLKTHPLTGVCVDDKLKFNQHVSNIVHKAGGVTSSILRSTMNHDSSFMLPFFTICVPSTGIHVLCLEFRLCGGCQTIRVSTKEMYKRNLWDGGIDYSQCLKSLNLYSVERGSLRHGILNIGKSSMAAC